MKVILYQPQIPQNTGNIVRTCSVTGSDLILTKPLGFSTSNRLLKRAGLDYWEGVDVQIIESLEEYLLKCDKNFYFFSSHAKNLYSEIDYFPDDILIFGSETAGLNPYFLTKYPEKFYTLPMKENSRCLNLANTVSIVLYEAWRQQGFST
ncbi:MAG: tRNA (cytidine(34)-2'-O)-methyltransferase [Chlamydiae bacterium]|nr:tRNA (cytidine(34)-2'-O)-methyltransferase [Chlamydiota bacterium]